MTDLSVQLQHQRIRAVAFGFSVRWDRVRATCWTQQHISDLLTPSLIHHALISRSKVQRILFRHAAQTNFFNHFIKKSVFGLDVLQVCFWHSCITLHWQSELLDCARWPRMPVIKSWCRYCSGTMKHTDAMEQLHDKKMLLKSQEPTVFSFNILLWKKNDLIKFVFLTCRLCFHPGFCSMYGFTQEMQALASEHDPMSWYLQKVPIGFFRCNFATVMSLRSNS